MKPLTKIITLGTGLMLASSPLKAQENELENLSKKDGEYSLSNKDYPLYKSGILAFVYLAPTTYVIASPNIQDDKKIHYFASYILTFGFGTIIQPEKWYGHLLVGGLALSAGVGKELYDEKYGTGFDKNDLLWDSLGILNGLTINFLIYGDFTKVELAGVGK